MVCVGSHHWSKNAAKYRIDSSYFICSWTVFSFNVYQCTGITVVCHDEVNLKTNTFLGSRKVFHTE